MAAQTCPSCGGALPPELGQHALVPTAGVVACPHCGATVALEGADVEGTAGEGTAGEVVGESTGPETFSGHETVEGVMDEIKDKEEA